MQLIRTIIATSALAFLAGSVSAGPNCTCRYAGQNYKTGEIMCIRGKLSKCEFVLNNTSWNTIADTCPQTNLDLKQQSLPPETKISLAAKMQALFSIQ